MFTITALVRNGCKDRRVRRRGVAVAARAVAAAMLVCCVGLATPALSMAVDIDFESPALPDGAVVSSQFAGHGVTFESGPPGGAAALPRMRTTDARSGIHALDISVDQTEFPTPRLVGRFDATRQSVTVHVRNVTRGDFATVMKLELLDASNDVVATDTATVSSTNPGYARLSAVSASADVLRFRLAPVNPVAAQGELVRVDDLSFEGTSVTPDFGLSASASALVVAQGHSRSTTIAIGRVNGSSGNIAFSAAGLPSGVTASFSPDPATGTGDATQLTLSASPDAAISPLPVHVTVTGTPASAAVGAAARTVEVGVVIRRAYELASSHAPAFSLAPCSTETIPMRIQRAETVDDPIGLTLDQSDGAPLPAGLSGTFEPASLSGLASQTSLRVTRGDTPPGGPFSLRARARSGSLAEQSLPFQVTYLPMSISSVSQDGPGGRPLRPHAPQALQPGDYIAVTGRGICPGARVEFGNPAGSAALVQLPSAPNSLGLSTWRARVPRLAGDGPVKVVNPSGASSTSSQTVDVSRYRDTNGFSFPNEPWQGGDFADWEELFGYDQTHIGIDLCFGLGCTITTPIPRLDLVAFFMPAANAALRGGNGTCIGFAIGSRRIITGQRSGFLPSAGKLWDLPRTERLIHYLRIQHQAQLGGEFLHRYLERRLAGALGSRTSSVLRREVENQLRAGRRPLITLAQGTSGHGVIAYDTEDRPGGGFFIRVWDNNVPALPAENTQPDEIASREGDGRIEVFPDNRWRFPSLGWSGSIGDIVVIGVENELPVRPAYPASLNGIHALVFGAGTSAGVSSAGARPRSAPGGERLPSGVTRFAPLDGAPIDAFLARTERANTFGIRADAQGHQHLTSFGDGRMADVLTAGARGGRAELKVTRGARGLRYETDAASVSLAMKLASRTPEGETHMAAITTRSFRGGGDEMSLGGDGRTLTLRHQGRDATVRLELSGYGGKALPGRFRGSLRVRAGERVTMRPEWRDLAAGRLAVTVQGTRGTRTLRLRNSERPALVVRSIHASARRSRRTVVVTVTTRLMGAPRGGVRGIGVVALAGGRKAGSQTHLVSGARVRRGTVTTKLTVPLRRGTRPTRVRVSTVAMSGHTPVASRKVTSARVR